MPVNIGALGCDFLSATGRKYFRGLRDTVFLYVSKKWLETLEPVMIDHFGAPWVELDRYELREDARRFETWENSYALRTGLGAAIEYAERVGINEIADRVSLLANTTRIILAEQAKIQLREIGETKCGTVSFSADHPDPRVILSKLRDEVIAIGASSASSTRIDSEKREFPTLLCIAPHYYNTEREIERTVERVSALL